MPFSNFLDICLFFILALSLIIAHTPSHTYNIIYIQKKIFLYTYIIYIIVYIPKLYVYNIPKKNHIYTHLLLTKKTFQNDHHHHHQNEQQQGHIQIPLPLHLDTSNSRTNHVPLNSTSVAVSAADSRSMILSLENNVNVVSNIIRDSENLVKIKCGQCRKVKKKLFIFLLTIQFFFFFALTSSCSFFSILSFALHSFFVHIYRFFFFIFVLSDNIEDI